MQWTSAPNIGEAPLPQRARSYWKTRFSAAVGEVENFLEAERAQLPPWFVVRFGSATRSATQIDWVPFTWACARADIVVSDRRLPRGCTPRWLKLDRAALSRTGGVAVYLGRDPHVDTGAERVGAHPWAQFAR